MRGRVYTDFSWNAILHIGRDNISLRVYNVIVNIISAVAIFSMTVAWDTDIALLAGQELTVHENGHINTSIQHNFVSRHFYCHFVKVVLYVGNIVEPL